MRRIKSAPADLFNLVNRKKSSQNVNVGEINESEEITKTAFIPLNSEDENVNNIHSIITDVVNDSNFMNLEELTLFNMLMTYFTETIFKKNRVEELVNFIVTYSFRYLILMIFHIQILHDKELPHLPF